MIARRHFDLPRVDLGAAAKRLPDFSLNVGGRGSEGDFDHIGHRLHAPDALNRPFSRFSLEIPFHRPFEREQAILYCHCDFAARKVNVAFQNMNGVLCDVSIRALIYHSHHEFIGEAFDAEKSLHRPFSRDLLRVIVHESGKRHYAILRSHADSRRIDFRLKVELVESLQNGLNYLAGGDYGELREITQRHAEYRAVESVKQPRVRRGVPCRNWHM